MGKKKIKKILITGAAGLCGSVLYDGLLRLGYRVIGCDIKKKPSRAANNLGIKINNKTRQNPAYRPAFFLKKLKVLLP